MPQTVTCRGPRMLLGDPRTGNFVMYGPAHAVWRVAMVIARGQDIELTLDPVDPHDVPIHANVRELPMLDRSV